MSTRTGGRVTLLTALVAGLLLVAPASARVYEVTRTNDPAPGDCRPRDCSLREAVLAANASVGVADRIILPERRRDYRLTRPGTNEDGALDGDLDLTDDPIQVLHRGRGRATIDAGGLGERIFESFVPTTLTKLVLTGGEASGVSNDSGGAIEAKADMTVRRSLLRSNVSEKFGGAIYHNNGTLRIVRSTLSANRSLDESGAIEVSGESLVLTRSTLRGNVAASAGAGGVYTSTLGPSRIDRTTFAGNRAPGLGGALEVNNGTIRVANSTFSGNRSSASNGGAISSFGELEVVNSTFWRNRAAGSGGAIYNGAGGNAKLSAATIVRNVADSDNSSIGSGGGLFNSPGWSFEIANSIVALNDQVGGDADDCAGAFDSLGGNLRTDGTDCGGFAGPGDAIRANPKIGRLAGNGGPTQTVALKRGSPAIGRAVRALAPERDQRGQRRDSNPDSGAFER